MKSGELRDLILSIKTELKEEICALKEDMNSIKMDIAEIFKKK
jgi:hypothetical protein